MMPARKNNWLPGIFNDFFGNEWLERQSLTAPAVNILENEKEYKVEIAAPGMTKDDFKIELEDNNHLIVSMEKKVENEFKDEDEEVREGEKKTSKKEPADHKYLRREFSYTSFRQSMILPDNVNKEKIKAKVEHGVLVVEIPKATEKEKALKTKLIEVK